MTISKVESQLHAQLQSVGALVPEEVGRFLAAPGRSVRRFIRDRAVLGPTLAMSAACLAAVVLGSLARGNGPWAGLNAIATGLPGLDARRRRQKRRFRPTPAIASVAAVAGGSLILVAMQGAVERRVGAGKLSRGLLAAGTALASDRFVMGRSFLRELREAIGTGGLLAVYGALGTAYALTSPRDRREQRDPTGGDISAGVPAM